MTDRPIIFSAPMIRALLDGRKSQTRRLAWGGIATNASGFVTGLRPSPWHRVQPGDRLWVREACAWSKKWEGRPDLCQYRADGQIVVSVGCWGSPGTKRMRWTPSIHMPRWASRLTLTVTEVRRQRLQEISEEDARAEGIRLVREGGGTYAGREGPGNLVTPWYTAKEAFADLWDSLHGAGAWESNPECVALAFSVERRNIDAAGDP